MSHEHDFGRRLDRASDRRILGAVALNMLLTVAQVVGGILSGSVALAADALHNLNDAMALVIVYVARRISRRRADARRTFGYERARVVGATVNLVALAVVGLFLAYESIARFFDPRDIDGWTMVFLAGVAIVVDVATVLILFRMRKGRTDVRAAFVHNLADALASVAVALGGIAILVAGWRWVDPLLSLLIVGYIFWQVARMLPRTIRVLMESAPEGLDLYEVRNTLMAVEGVEDAHHLHAWMLDERRTAMEAHLVVSEPRMRDMEEIKERARKALRDRFGIQHATLELELPSAARSQAHSTAVIGEDTGGGS